MAKGRGQHFDTLSDRAEGFRERQRSTELRQEFGEAHSSRSVAARTVSLSNCTPKSERQKGKD